MNIKTVLIAIACIATPLLIGGVSGIFTIEGVNGWYTTLQKPSFNPPNWLFGPVWTLLYAMMGLALFLIIYATTTQSKTTAVALFAFQIVLNFFWSIIFFKWQSPGYALAEIAVLWICILLTIISFWSIHKTAALLLVPYLIWVSFAAVLNVSIWWLNR
ncbi:MAG: tryptophan-rich sensory protein [Chitinophagales bacterium]|nr:tryptophan-rich sensory protein [Chitinophagales bacterium]